MRNQFIVYTMRYFNLVIYILTPPPSLSECQIIKGQIYTGFGNRCLRISTHYMEYRKYPFITEGEGSEGGGGGGGA